jgi:hypothetical protein
MKSWLIEGFEFLPNVTSFCQIHSLRPSIEQCLKTAKIILGSQASIRASRLLLECVGADGHCSIRQMPFLCPVMPRSSEAHHGSPRLASCPA